MAGGRPTKYTPEVCERIVEFFSKEPFTPVKTVDGDPVIDRNGVVVMQPCKLPTLEGFAIQEGIGTSTIWDWSSNHPQFSAAIMQAKQRQKDILIQNGLFGLYEKTFAKFVAINVTDMVEKSQQEITGKDGKDLRPAETISTEDLLALKKNLMNKND